jgi:hypothetical protein
MNSYQPKGLKIYDIEIISIGLAHGVCEFATFNAKDLNSVNEISLAEI